MFQTKASQLLLLFVVGAVAGTIANQNTPSLNDVHFGVYFGSLIGTGIGLMLMTLVLSFIPSLIYRIARGHWPKWIIWLCFPLMIPILYLIHIGSSEIPPQLAGSEVGRESEYLFSQSPCEFGATFPGEPNIETVTFPDLGHAVQATLSPTQNTFLRAECPDYGDAWDGSVYRATDEDWVEWMAAYMQAQGFSNIEISEPSLPSNDDVPLVLQGRGHKDINSVPGTFRVQVVAGEQSVLFMYAGEPSRIFPSRELTTFMGGYQRVGN